jgi:hypothetical protein
MNYSFSFRYQETRIGRGEKGGAARGHPVKMVILKIEIAREPARDRRENMARFVLNDKMKIHVTLPFYLFLFKCLLVPKLRTFFV